jgi:hypothetical protein
LWQQHLPRDRGGLCGREVGSMITVIDVITGA